MLTLVELSSLSHLLRDERVLSVYIDGASHDPALRHAWRVHLDHALKEARRSTEGASHSERAAIDDCIALLEERLARIGGAVGAPGWVAFVTQTRVHHAEAVPAPVPTIAIWGNGPLLTPYVRALKQNRPVVAVIADARKARLYCYAAGALTPAESIHAHAVTEPPLHMGNPPSPGFHGGTRGATGHDAAQRALAEGTSRMVDDVARSAVGLAGSDGWIIVGGIAAVAAQVTRAIELVVGGRVRHVESLDVHATDAQVEAAARQGASDLRDAADLKHLAEITSHAATATVTLGQAATRHALDQSCVRELLLTEQYVKDHAVDAEQAVRAALAQDAVVEVVSRDVARRLDGHGGIVARLRYQLPERETAALTSSDDRHG